MMHILRLATLLLAASVATGAPRTSALPQRLQDTGLYRPGTSELAAGVRSYTPQYALWSDGAAKQRWIWLPPGTAIDASQPDAWRFPPGTRFWKEFTLGRRIETRFIEYLDDGSWRYATYVWNEAGTEAMLAPDNGLPALQIEATRYDIPSTTDCRACHEGGASPVLGFSALQLSPERDPLAAHAQQRREDDMDLRDPQALGWLRDLPPLLLVDAPRIVARDPVERAALGYLHANCGHCHNDVATPVPLQLQRADAEVLQQALVHHPLPGAGNALHVIAPGDPAHSTLVLRMRSREPSVQMPPLGTRIADAEGLALIERWIAGLNPQQEGTSRE